MKTRPLGRSGLDVSVISFGAWPIAGGMGEVSEQQAIDTVRAAVDAGMTFIDTAEAYGPGPLGAVRHSEAILGQVLGQRRDAVSLCTKVSNGDNSSEHINRAIDNSLRMLQTDHVDVYLLHGPDRNGYTIEKSMEALHELKKQGKTRAIGVSNFSLEQLAEAQQYGQLDCYQLKYHMLFRDEARQTMPFCRDHGIGVTTHSTLAKGLLTGHYRPGHVFAEGDERRHMSGPFKGQGMQRTLEVADRLRTWAEARGRSLVQLAIAWALAHPTVSAAIVGPKTPQQMREAAQAADWELTPAELREIDELQKGFIL